MSQAAEIVTSGVALARLAGLSNLHPSVVVVGKVLAAIGSRRASLSQDATRALYGLITETANLSTLTSEAVGKRLEESLRSASERDHVAILEAISQVGQLAELEGDSKTAVLVEIIRSNGETRRKEIEALMRYQMLGGVVVGLPAIILAIGKAIDIARPNKWHESLFGTGGR